MKIQELSSKYNIAESTIKKNFTRFQKTILDRFGVQVTKTGRGENTEYVEQIIEDAKYKHADDIFSVLSPLNENAGLVEADLNLENFAFKVFIGILTTPMMVFRGTEDNLLTYLKINHTNKNKELLREAVRTLNQRQMIITILNDDVMILAVARAIELNLKLGYYMIVKCKQLADKYNMRDWVCLLKIWTAVQIICNNGTYTRDLLKQMTGLSLDMITKCSKILVNENIFASTNVYYKTFIGETRCAGKETQICHELFISIDE